MKIKILNHKKTVVEAPETTVNAVPETHTLASRTSASVIAVVEALETTAIIFPKTLAVSEALEDTAKTLKAHILKIGLLNYFGETKHKFYRLENKKI